MSSNEMREHSVNIVESTTLFGRAAGQMRQWFCGLHGHDALMHFERGRISLQCTSCGYESPGWDLSASTPPVTGTVERRARIAPAPLVSERRAA